MAEEQEGLRLNELTLLESLHVSEGSSVIFIYNGDNNQLLSGFSVEQEQKDFMGPLKTLVESQGNYFIEMEVKQVFIPGTKH